MTCDPQLTWMAYRRREQIQELQRDPYVAHAALVRPLGARQSAIAQSEHFEHLVTRSAQGHVTAAFALEATFGPELQRVA